MVSQVVAADCNGLPAGCERWPGPMRLPIASSNAEAEREQRDERERLVAPGRANGVAEIVEEGHGN